jgi:two-component system chemotaxis response regulator CheY
MRIMLCDDSTTMRRIQKTQLSNIGVSDIVEAGDGIEGLKVLAESMPVDFLLLDWNMPRMDGITMLQELRAKPEFKAEKDIMCTSESEKTIVIEALKAGANQYMVKPFTPDILKEKLGI